MDIIVPVKRFALAKQRLAGIATPQQRAALAAAMAAHVLAELRRVRGLARILVVSDEPQLAALAAGYGCTLVEERGGGLNAALADALTRIPADGEVGIVHADLPLLTAGSFARLLHGHRRRSGARITLVSDAAGQGTNILLASPGSRLIPCFGPASAARHRAMGRHAGATVHTACSPRLSRDCDTPDDLAAFAGNVRPGSALDAALTAMRAFSIKSNTCSFEENTFKEDSRTIYASQSERGTF